MPPICIPIELKFAKPQSANVAIVKERGSSVPFIGPRNENATSSFSTVRTPSKLPMDLQSCQGTPIIQATGAKIQPKICCSDEGKKNTNRGGGQKSEKPRDS